MLPTPSLVGEKYTYANAQFDPEIPSTLDGVMQRWIVPEGEEEKAPIERVVPLLNVQIEGGLFGDTQEDKRKEEPSYLPSSHELQRSLYSPSRKMYFVIGFTLLMVINLAFLIFIFLTRK